MEDIFYKELKKIVVRDLIVVGRKPSGFLGSLGLFDA